MSAPGAEVRRKINVIVWGAVLGTLPIVLVQTAAANAGRSYLEFPVWVWQPSLIMVQVRGRSVAGREPFG